MGTWIQALTSVKLVNKKVMRKLENFLSTIIISKETGLTVLKVEFEASQNLEYVATLPQSN